ncbi:chorismate mutase [Ureibacillus chungkukjangi]|uniref:chorismate mutase n=1 Tax=Ureibacillus chungkukjangi TaxID=1202712 RepID=A0A318TG39_9BACL|nr:chorismate mutase [Ureibacillus chungkukjangi]MCM3389063.1 chorismate mutase [Ureibacillus chungkukjangi]PYF02827.1 chorismate mutase [Ureibacillus chungkukjangi]
MIRGVRGATTVTDDIAELILNETEILVKEIATVNNIQPEDIISVLISTTTDISSGFPAKAVRSIEGWQYVPTMCTHEMSVPNALPMCIRVLLHVNTELSQKDIRHVYLNEAVCLRPDLVQEANK